MNQAASTAPARVYVPQAPDAQETGLLYDHRGRIRVKDPARDRALHWFLIAFGLLGLGALWLLRLDGAQLIEGVGKIPEAVGKLAKLDFSQLGVTFTSLLESISVAILATVYSLLGGMALAVLLAKNLTPFRGLSLCLSAVMTFLRAIPSIIWVLLVLVCVGFGPEAGIIGICIFSTSFFCQSLCPVL